MVTSLFSFIIVLGVLIFFHELGHFLVARYFGVGVEKFSLGFGPRILGKKVGITDYRISAIPLGGYVKMVGEEPDAEIAPENIPLSFTHKHVVKKFLIVAAGPFFNLLLAVLLFYLIYQFSGLYVRKPVVGSVAPDTPAQTAGLRPGDEIASIDGVSVESWEEMAAIISESNGKPVQIELKREGRTVPITIEPRVQQDVNIFGEKIERFVIGIGSSNEFATKELSMFQAIGHSVVQTYKVAELTVLSIVKLIQGTLSMDTLGGPIMIAELAGEQAEEGLINLLFFIGLLSINLAILNFLPIPVLDGGHLLFFTIEMLIGRPVSIRVREVAQQAGIFILISLMIFVFYNDITRFWFN